jgi:hypothetical protein
MAAPEIAGTALRRIQCLSLLRRYSARMRRKSRLKP